jgi:MFS family permease
LAVIFFANFLSYLDRQIVGALEHELSLAHGLSQKEFGIVGSAFTVGYMVFAPVIGFLTGRFLRPRIFALCVLVWSLATIGSGFAPTKGLLYLTRFFIGIGEAGCLVIGPTLISEYFPKEVRGKALSIFFLGLPLGGTAGYIVGGLLTQMFGWQYAFFFAGLPGFLATALIWMLDDPRQTGAGEPAAPPGEAEPPGEGIYGHALVRGFRPYLDLLRNRTLFLIILAQAFAVMFLQPLLLFGVGFFEKERHMSKQQATVALGILALVAGFAGNMLSGVIGDRLARRTKGAYALLAGFGFTFGLPWLLLGFSTRVKFLAIPALGLGAFCYFLCMPAVNTQIANVVSARQRAMAFALAVFILHLLGDAAAPPVFGAVADAIGNKQKAFVAFSFSLLLAGASCFLAARTAARDAARATAAEPPPSPPPIERRPVLL